MIDKTEINRICNKLRYNEEKLKNLSTCIGQLEAIESIRTKIAEAGLEIGEDTLKVITDILTQEMEETTQRIDAIEIEID